MASGATWRNTSLARLADEVFDVLVVGGGATGAAIARDAALRGLRVALCEQGDFAGQTSSQSSKLIHGGLRYLQYGNLHLVFEGLAERHRLMATAPHLCRPIEFLFPAYRGEKPSLAVLGMGVALYDALALWRGPTRSRRVPARDMYEIAPALRSAGLRGAELYFDCQTDDARLVLENILDAEAAGAVAASYVRVERPPSTPRSAVRTAMVRDQESGSRFAVQARAVVNATGPFSDSFSSVDSAGPRALRPTLGVHVVFDADRVPTGGRAIVIRSPRDGRLIFTLPAGSRTIIGTTDTDWRPPGDDRPPRPEDDIRARAQDVDYLLEAARHAFPPARLERSDVISTFAGLRPLIASADATPSATSREHEIWVNRQGILTVVGGKLTTMRRMAEEAVDQLIELLRDRGLDRPLERCQTRTRPLPGAGSLTDFDQYELASDVRVRLATAYGARAGHVLALTGGDSALAERIMPGLPFLRAEIVAAARFDHATQVEDVLRRRMPMFRDSRDQGLSAAEATADVLAGELGWSAARRARSVADYRAAVAMSRCWREEPTTPLSRSPRVTHPSPAEARES